MTIRDIVVAFGFEVDRSSEKQAESSIKGLKNMATKLLGSIAVVFSVSKLTSFAKDCAQAASTVQEMENKFDVVFDNLKDDVDQWAGEFADSIGRNKNAIKTYLADQQNLLVGFGMTREEGAALSKEMTSLALDIASFANQDEDVAVNAMTKAVMGESEAAKTLGAVLNDTTRAETMAAMGLAGTYNSLDQLTKMQVNYQTILRQSPDAVGDCVRSMDSYEAKTRQLNSAIAEFKEFIGGQLLPVFSIFTGWMAKGVKAATSFAKAIFLDQEENNRLLKGFERIHAVVKRLHPAMERFSQSMKSGIDKTVGMVKTIAARLGGIENLFKVLAAVAGAFFIAMNWGKAVGAAKGFVSMLSAIGKMIGAVRVDILAAVAVIAVLLLIIDDFVNFLLGNDSVIGTVFDQMGIGADQARQAVFEAFSQIRDFLLQVWNFLKTAAGTFMAVITDTMAAHMDEIKSVFISAWQVIQQALILVWNVIKDVAEGIFGGIYNFLKNENGSAKEKILAIWQEICNGLGDILGSVITVITTGMNFVLAVISQILCVIQTVWDVWGNQIVTIIRSAFSFIGAVLETGAAAFQKISKTVNNAAQTFKEIGSTVGRASEFFKGNKEALALLGVAVGTITALVVAYNAASIASAAASGAETAAIMALYAADGIAAVAKGALTAATAAWSTVAGAAATVTAGLGAAISFLASPIGIVIVAVGALIAAGVLLYQHWEDVKAFSIGIWTAIGEFFSSILGNIAESVRGAFEDIYSFVTDKIPATRDVIINGLNVAADFIKGLPLQAVQWGADFIGGLKNGILSGVQGVVAAVKGVGERIRSFLHFSVPDEGPLTDYESWMPDFMNGLATSMQGSSGVLIETINGITEVVKGQFADAFTQAGEQTSFSMDGITESVTAGINQMAGFLKGLSGESVQWGADFINGLKDGILSGVQGVADAAKGIGERIRSFLHFSVPDEGPLTDYESWMPDFMNGLAAGISQNEDTVLDKIRSLAGGIQTLMSAATANAATAAAGTINNTTSSITQNVNIDNSYSGGSSEVQKNVSKAMKRSASDATTQMARALAYTRG